MNAPYFLTKAIDVWVKTDSLWRILSSYENKVIMDLAFLNPVALEMIYHYRDSLKRYAEIHKKTGREMKDDELVKIVVLTLIHNLSKFVQSDVLKIVLQWGSLLYKPKKMTIPTAKEWEGIELLSIEHQFVQTNLLFNRYWYSSNDNEELYQSEFTKKKWKSFWSTIKRFEMAEKVQLPHKISKPIVWLSIWWTFRKASSTNLSKFGIERPNWTLLKAFDGDMELIPDKIKTNNVEGTDDLFRDIRMTLSGLGLRGKNSVDDAISEGWTLDEFTKIELKDKIIEWLELT